MSTADLRRQAQQRIECLSAERLRVALDFLAYLEERDSNEATEELLKIPGFVGALEDAEREIAAGHVTPVTELRRNG